MVKDLKFKKIKDDSDKLIKVDKGQLFNLPMRLLCVGKSGTGKTSALVSLLLDKRYYKNDFKPQNIYIFSPGAVGGNDHKMELLIENKNIPMNNLFTEFDDDILNALYDNLVEEFKTEKELKKKKIDQKLIILDDLSFDGSLRNGNYNSVARLMMNGRKHGINIIVTAQYMSHILPSCRFNANGLILFNMNEKELDLVSDEQNYAGIPKKSFKELIRNQFQEFHDCIIINYTNSKKNGIYLNNNFEKII
jgi:hypothetical protein